MGDSAVRDGGALTSETVNVAAVSCRRDTELLNGTRLTPQTARLALATPSKCELATETKLDTETTTTSTLRPEDSTASQAGDQMVEPSVRKRRAIFTDDGEDDEAAAAEVQVFSVDTAPALAAEATMEPEREGGIVPRVSRCGTTAGAPRARRVLNLLDRLDQSTGGENATEGDETRRTWKRRLTTRPISETATTASADDAQDMTLLLSPPPPRGVGERRPAFARSHSSQSVFLAPPRMSFARSTSTPGRDESHGPSSATAKPHTLVLPTVRSRNHPDLNVIAPQTVADLLSGVYGDRLDSFSLIDCRFGYEYDGGSLKGAVSMNDPAQVEEKFLRKPPKNSARTALIFYCEFSANRAPKMLRHVRNLDRWIHAERYPELFYPELYLIDGGYKNCFETLKEVICHPPTYQTMSDKAFVEQCKRDFATHRANWKLHKSNACASKFQQLHRPAHGVFGDDSHCDEYRSEDDLLAYPLALRSFSQQH